MARPSDRRLPAKSPAAAPSARARRTAATVIDQRGAAASGRWSAGEGSRRVRSGDAGQGFEVEGDVAGRLEPLLRVLLQAVPHDPVETRMDVLVGLGQIRRLLRQDRRDRVRRRVPPERPLPRQHLVQDRPEGEEVAAAVGRPSRAPARAPCSPSFPSTTPGSVPEIVFRSVRPSPSSAVFSFARPKSRIFTRPSFVTNRFSGFRSRCTIPFSCAAESPFAIWIA